MDERELIDAARRGDRDAFCDLVATHQAAVRGYLASLVIEPEAAFDLAQEVFLSAHRKLGDFDPERPLRPWLLGIARTTALAHNRAAVRRARRERTAGALTAALAEERALPADGRLTALRRCLDQLATARPEVHELLDRRYLQAAPAAAIATDLGIADGALRVRLLRAREVLRHCIQQRLEAEA